MSNLCQLKIQEMADSRVTGLSTPMMWTPNGRLCRVFTEIGPAWPLTTGYEPDRLDQVNLEGEGI